MALNSHVGTRGSPDGVFAPLPQWRELLFEIDDLIGQEVHLGLCRNSLRGIFGI